MNIKFLEIKRAYYADPENVQVQVNYGDGDWYTLCEEPSWKERDYRIRPRTIRIGEIDVPEPVRDELPLGVNYYYPTSQYTEISAAEIWQGDAFDKCLLERGLIHLTREAAEQHAKALIIVSGGRYEREY